MSDLTAENLTVEKAIEILTNATSHLKLNRVEHQTILDCLKLVSDACAQVTAFEKLAESNKEVKNG